MSTRVNLDDLSEGMVLAENARHINGRVLLNEEICLTIKHIKMFRSWGLTDVLIKGDVSEKLTRKLELSIDPEALLNSQDALKNNFQYMDMNFVAVSELVRICIKLHAEKKVRTDINVNNS